MYTLCRYVTTNNYDTIIVGDVFDEDKFFFHYDGYGLVLFVDSKIGVSVHIFGWENVKLFLYQLPSIY